MTTQTEAQKHIDCLEHGNPGDPIAAELRRLEADKDDWKDASFVFKERAVKAEARIKELEAANVELVEALHHISLCSRNSMSSQRQCGEIARAAIKKHGGK